MKRSKRVFLIIAALFILTMVYISYDISRRTTFPGSKSRFEETFDSQDSINTESDSLQTETD